MHLRQLIIVPNKYLRELGLGAVRPHTLGEGGRPWLESVINSPIASCIVLRSLLSRPGTRTTGRTITILKPLNWHMWGLATISQATSRTCIQGVEIWGPHVRTFSAWCMKLFSSHMCGPTYISTTTAPHFPQQLVFWETLIGGSLEHIQSYPIIVLMCRFLIAVMWGSFPFLDSLLVRCPRWNSCSFGPISVYSFYLRHWRNSYFGYCYSDGYPCHPYPLPPDGFQFSTPRDISYEEFFILIQLEISASLLEMVFFLGCSGILPHHSSWRYLLQYLIAALLFVSLNRSSAHLLLILVPIWARGAVSFDWVQIPCWPQSDWNAYLFVTSFYHLFYYTWCFLWLGFISRFPILFH